VNTAAKPSMHAQLPTSWLSKGVLRTRVNA